MKRFVLTGLAGLLLAYSAPANAQAGKPEKGNPPSQVVFLNFEGKDSSGAWPKNFAVRPFGEEAEYLEESFLEHSRKMKKTVTASVRGYFGKYNIHIVSSDEMKMESIDGEFSQVYFGGTCPLGGHFSYSLGMSETIDVGNLRKDDNAVVFTRTFLLFKPFNPSWETYSRLMGLLAAHEIGHLLGLSHDNERFSIMSLDGNDGTHTDKGQDSSLQVDKSFSFKRASSSWPVPPDSATFQDAPAYLERMLGPAPAKKR